MLLVTDIGPDPDDAKALLLAATMHKERHITLRGVIANGGQQAKQRAVLARCVLDHLGVLDVPVGFGSEGKMSAPQPHEYTLQGFANVDGTRLLPGARLFSDVLQKVPSKSLLIVLISSLRDMADAIDADAALVLRKVHTVAIQGGLVADSSRPSGWRADSSVNNCFDMEAAEKVYAFCFESGLPMRVTSRYAVPLLPMQLAKSFATRTKCPVMSYLADAQLKGLEGLWLKLCNGALPSRCTKAWYFETFCGVFEREFVQNRFDDLGASADIGAYLNGFVKPYDVLALMTVLPASRQLFSKEAVFQYRDIPHLLLLETAHAINAALVLNLLRDTYHEIVMVTAADKRSVRGESRAAELKVRRYDVHAMLGASRTVGGTGALEARRTKLPFRVARVKPVAHVRARKFAAFADGAASAQKPRSRASASAGADGGHTTEHDACACVVLSREEVVSMLSNVLALAGERQRSVTWFMIALGFTLMLACFALVVAISLKPFWLTGIKLETLETFMALASFTGMAAVYLSLRPTQAHRVRVRVIAGVVGSLLGAAWVVLGDISDLLYAASANWNSPWCNGDCDTHPAAHAFLFYKLFQETLYFLTWGIASFALVGLAILSACTARVCTKMLLSAMWLHLGGAAFFFSMYLAVVSSLDLNARAYVFEPGFTGPSRRMYLINIFVSALLLVQSITTQSRTFRSSLIRLVARIFSARGVETSLAPLLGFGSKHGEREPEELQAEAARSFQPQVLDEALLERLEAVGLNAHMLGADAAQGRRARSLTPPSFVSSLARRAQSQLVGLRRTHDGSSHQAAVARRTESEMSEPLPSTEADAYIVHCAADDPRLRAAALCRWARAFSAAHQRTPSVWIDVLCADPSFSRAEALAHVPVHQAMCSRLVLLAGPALVEQLEPVAHCFIWEAIGGRLKEAHVELAAANAAACASTIAGLDAFHVMHMHVEPGEVCERILAMVDIASASRLNVTIRELLDPARRAASALTTAKLGAHFAAT